MEAEPGVPPPGGTIVTTKLTETELMMALGRIAFATSNFNKDRWAWPRPFAPTRKIQRAPKLLSGSSSDRIVSATG